MEAGDLGFILDPAYNPGLGGRAVSIQQLHTERLVAACHSVDDDDDFVTAYGQVDFAKSGIDHRLANAHLQGRRH